MKTRPNPIPLAAAFLLLVTTNPLQAETTVKNEKFLDDKRVMTVGGTLAVRANRKDDTVMDVVLKDKVVATIDADRVSLDYKFSVKGSDVVLLHGSLGASCPATYHFVLIAPDGKTVLSGKEGFGNCDDRATLSYDDQAATLTLPAVNDGRPSKGKTVERWVWDYSAKPPFKHK